MAANDFGLISKTGIYSNFYNEIFTLYLVVEEYVSSEGISNLFNQIKPLEKYDDYFINHYGFKPDVSNVKLKVEEIDRLVELINLHLNSGSEDTNFYLVQMSKLDYLIYEDESRLKNYKL